MSREHESWRGGRRVGYRAGALALLLVSGCAAVFGLEDLDELREPPPSVDAEPDATPDAEPEPKPEPHWSDEACPKQFPQPDALVSGTRTRVFVFDRYRLGEWAPGDDGEPLRAGRPGFDLDCTATSNLNTGSCRPRHVDGGLFEAVFIDGERGVDNAMTVALSSLLNAVPALAGGLERSDPIVRLHQRASTLLRIESLGTEPDDARVVVTLMPGAYKNLDLEETTPCKKVPQPFLLDPNQDEPKVSSDEQWCFDRRFDPVSQGPNVRIVSDRAQILDGYLVAHFPRVELPYDELEQHASLSFMQMTDVWLRAKVEVDPRDPSGATWRLRDGAIGGRGEVESLLRQLIVSMSERAPRSDDLNDPRCRVAMSTFVLLEGAGCSLADLAELPEDDGAVDEAGVPRAECGRLSIGASFQAREVLPPPLASSARLLNHETLCQGGVIGTIALNSAPAPDTDCKARWPSCLPPTDDQSELPPRCRRAVGASP